MGEKEVFIYSLNFDNEELILKMSKEDNNIRFSLEKSNGDKYSILIISSQIKEVYKAFHTSMTLNELLIFLHNTIESGNISLIKDENDKSIELKFKIKSGKNYQQFGVKLKLENKNKNLLKKRDERIIKENNKNSLPAKFDYGGNIEAEKKYGKSTKNTTEYNKPIVQPNYNQPVMQFEYIEPILQMHYPDGTTKSLPLPPRIQTIDGQIPNIDDAQFKMIQQEMNKYMGNQIQNINSSKYSMQSVPVKNGYYSVENEINNNGEKSKFSTFSVKGRPIVFPEQKFINKNSNLGRSNNIIEYLPNIIHQAKINFSQDNQSYSHRQSNINYNNFISKNNTNSFNYQTNSKYQVPNYMQNKTSYNRNQAYSQSKKNNYNNQLPNYQYHNNYSNLQHLDHSFDQVISSQIRSQTTLQQKKFKKYNIRENIPNKGKSNKNYKINKGEKELKGMENDIERLYRTEEGLIIFRNGILKGIINKYAEIDDVVSRIQDIILKGAKFNLLYKATFHGDKSSIFHEKCNKHPMTLVLVETDKGIRFGGFTRKTWDGNCEKKKDNDAFVFNVNKNTIFEIVPNQPAIGCYPKCGPVFLGCQIRIYNDFFIKGGSTCHRGLNYKTNKDFELNNGEQTYIVKDIEVYDIEAIDV